MKNTKITIRITLDSVGLRLLVVALLAAGTTGSVAWALESAGPAESGSYAPQLQAGSGRHYYLTNGPFSNGSEALDDCDTGYHMASLWEILDVSNLVYDTGRGFTYGQDTGEGPPTDFGGWIRTGQSSYTGTLAGWANCAAWTSSDGGDYGTYVMLPSRWMSETDIGVWETGTNPCSTSAFVWCVED